jgi:hypothetical protein
MFIFVHNRFNFVLSFLGISSHDYLFLKGIIDNKNANVKVFKIKGIMTLQIPELSLLSRHRKDQQ